MSFVASGSSPYGAVAAPFGNTSAFGVGVVGVGVGAPFSVGAGGCCGVSAVRAAAPVPFTATPCLSYVMNANPTLYMLADSPCAIAKVCNGRPYRSYATINDQGNNIFLSKGLTASGAYGCGATFVAAPLTASICPCDAPFTTL